MGQTNGISLLDVDKWSKLGLTALGAATPKQDYNQLFMLNLDVKISDPSWVLKSGEIVTEIAQLSPTCQCSEAIVNTNNSMPLYIMHSYLINVHQQSK